MIVVASLAIVEGIAPTVGPGEYVIQLGQFILPAFLRATLQPWGLFISFNPVIIGFKSINRLKAKREHEKEYSPYHYAFLTYFDLMELLEMNNKTS